MKGTGFTGGPTATAGAGFCGKSVRHCRSPAQMVVAGSGGLSCQTDDEPDAVGKPEPANEIKKRINRKCSVAHPR